MIVVTFALPEESRDFRRAIGAVRGAGSLWLATMGNERVLIAHCGVGPDVAAQRTGSLLASHQPRMLIATGFAGALDPALALGELVIASNLSDPALVARSQAICRGARSGVLTSAERPVEAPVARRALAAQTGAIAVDMESAPVAGACARAGVPLLVLRAISDVAEDSLPVPFDEWFDITRQRPRPGALLLFLARHPRQIAPFVRFVRGLRPARRALADFLLKFIASSAEEKSAG